MLKLGSNLFTISRGTIAVSIALVTLANLRMKAIVITH